MPLMRRTRLVGELGCVLAEPGVLAAHAEGVDEVIALGEERHHLGDLLRGVLQVGVEGDEPIAARVGQAGGDRRMLAEVARELHQHQLRMERLLGPHQARSAIARAVVDADHLPAHGQRPAYREEAAEERRYVALLVVHRDDHRELDGVVAGGGDQGAGGGAHRRAACSSAAKAATTRSTSRSAMPGKSGMVSSRAPMSSLTGRLVAG